MLTIKAINKPKSISSAQVLRDIQQAFNPSKLFAPWLHSERTRISREREHQRHRRKHKRIEVKVGHGGTLDPMATGVLIVGVGKGTKHLQTFLGCTKTYEATILFGAATDTYDVFGKVLSTAPYAHVTLKAVEEALKTFRGSINQKPPLFSALRMDGKRLYEYAREGKEIPRKIQERPVRTESLEIREWLPAGSHQYAWPKDEADDEQKYVAVNVLHLGEARGSTEGLLRDPHEPPNINSSHGTKRRRDGDDVLTSTSSAAKRHELSYVPLVSRTPQQASQIDKKEIYQTGGNQERPRETEPKHAPPAARLSMTVTSGFYVRSLCHDLGQAVGSLGIMSELVRTRQGEFEIGHNVLEYDDLSKGEDVWAPKVTQMLGDWQGKVTGELVNWSSDVDQSAEIR
ncbi:MAG: hypothetical protein Q9177_003139 [Variospora cf. flavescens]